MITNKPRSVKTLWMLIALFVSPFIIAVILWLNKDYLSLKTTEKGNLIIPPLPVQILSQYNLPTKKWRIVYLSVERCQNEICLKRKKILSKIHTALGVDKKRVEVLTIPSNHLAIKGPIGYQALILTNGNTLIIDPLDNAVLHYGIDANPNDILKDMRHLLKYSKF